MADHDYTGSMHETNRHMMSNQMHSNMSNLNLEEKMGSGHLIKEETNLVTGRTFNQESMKEAMVAQPDEADEESIQRDVIAVLR